MSDTNWSALVSSGEAASRAGGRRRFNNERASKMWARRFAILNVAVRLEGNLPHGFQKVLAERYGVNKSAISRDVAWVKETGFVSSGLYPLRCKYRRGEVEISWSNPRPSLKDFIREAGGMWALKRYVKQRG